jgi:hypothetical protein
MDKLKGIIKINGTHPIFLVFREIESFENFDCVELKRFGVLTFPNHFGQTLDGVLLHVGEDLKT